MGDSQGQGGGGVGIRNVGGQGRFGGSQWKEGVRRGGDVGMVGAEGGIGARERGDAWERGGAVGG